MLFADKASFVGFTPQTQYCWLSQRQERRGGSGVKPTFVADTSVVLELRRDLPMGDVMSELDVSELAESPEWLFALTERPKSNGQGGEDEKGAIPEGCRNDVLTSLAGSFSGSPVSPGLRPYFNPSIMLAPSNAPQTSCMPPIPPCSPLAALKTLSSIMSNTSCNARRVPLLQLLYWGVYFPAFS